MKIYRISVYANMATDGHDGHTGYTFVSTKAGAERIAAAERKAGRAVQVKDFTVKPTKHDVLRALNLHGAHANNG